MSHILIVLCSPRAQGVTDSLGLAFARGAQLAGVETRVEALRQHDYKACTGCNFCRRPPHVCVFDEDGASRLFAMFQQASLVVFASPIYFYALPAHFKAFIDRGQKFWASSAKVASPTPVLVFLNAARPRGRLLFSGALRTIRWFLADLGAKIEDMRLYRGMEEPDQIAAAALEDLRALGTTWARKLKQP